MANTLTIRLLGEVTIELGGKPVIGLATRKTEALLIFLACNRRPYAREVLADMLWDDRPQEQALANLRSILSGLRPVLGPHLIANRQTVAFNRESSYWLDAEAFEWQLTPMLGPLTSGETRPDEAAILRLKEVLRLYQGDFLAGYYLRESRGFEEWASLERERLRRLAVSGLAYLVEQALNAGDYAEGIHQATRLLQFDTLNEDAHRQLMLMLARSGQLNAALAQYNTCRQLLAGELGVSPSPSTVALFDRIYTARSVQPPLLPAYPTPFVGRAGELNEIQRQLTDPAVRLLTLLGPGGGGKTRLALEAATRINATQPGRFLHGIYWIPLLSLESTSQLIAALAKAVNLSLNSSAEPREQLLNFLREKEMLLVLDNFEHLLDSAGTGVGLLLDVLRQAPMLKLLVTTRERLNLYEEWVFDVGGLRLPSGESVAELEASDATQLFLHNARRIQRGFLAGPPDTESAREEAAATVRVCQWLDGMPLGIELASAWVRQFTVREILSNIETSFDFLATPLHNIPERHRSLRAVFEQSWQLLTGKEKDAVRQLSVFRGPFRLEAALAVAGAAPELLADLVDQSLLNQIQPGQFDLHPLLRQYAAEKLAGAPAESDAAHERHCDYFAEFLQGREAALKGSLQTTVLTEIGVDIANIRGAWQWAVAHENVSALDRLLVSLHTFYSLRHWLQEGQALLALAADSPLLSRPGNEFLATKIAVRQADIHSWLGAYDEAKVLLVRSIRICRELQSLPELALALFTLGRIQYWTGEFAEARKNDQESLSLWREIGDPHETASVLNNLANVICDETADYDQARPLYAESLALSRQIDDPYGIANGLLNLGAIAMEEADYPKARPLFEESLVIYREIGYRNGEWAALKNLGHIATRTGNHAAARELVEQSLRINRETGDRRAILAALSELGRLNCELGDFKQAHMLFNDALQLALEINTPHQTYEVLITVTRLLVQRNATGTALEVLAFVLNQKLGQETRDRAQERLTELQSQLPPEVVAQYQERGRAKQLEDIVAGILAELQTLRAG